MNPLRILVVLPLYGGSLPIGRFAAQALQDLGHIVDIFEAPAFQSSYQALRGLKVSSERLEQLESAFLNTVSQALYARAESFEPDLVLALAQAPLSRQILKRFQRDGVCTAMWFVEDHQVFTYWRAFAPLYDFFFVIQKEPFLSLLAQAGVQHAAYLPMAALPSFHKKTSLSPDEQRMLGADIAFLGAGYPNRRKAFQAFLEYDFKIWGSDWEGERLLAKHIQNNGQRISPEEGVKIYNATKVNLNLHSNIDMRELVPGGDFVNPRTFEIAAMGAFQLVNRRGLMAELFELEGPQAELATFTTMEELETALAHYLAHPDQRQAVAERGQARVLAEHTYAHRMQSLLHFIAEQRPQWPAERQRSQLPENLPPAVRADLAALLERLQMPASSSFEDVVTRVRQEQGVLDSMEASLLFLDEWRKQYGRA